jgi:hypothetical protein
MSPQYMTPPKIAAELGVSVNKVLHWITRGELPAVDISTDRATRPRWKVAVEDLAAFLESRRNKESNRRRKAGSHA